MALTYDEVARLLALLDHTAGQALDLQVGSLQLSVIPWHEDKSVNSSLADSGDLLAVSTSHVDASTQQSECERTDLPTSITAQTIGIWLGALTNIGVRMEEGDCIGEIETADGERIKVLATRKGQLADIDLCEGDFVEYGQLIAIVEKP